MYFAWQGRFELNKYLINGRSPGGEYEKGLKGEGKGVDWTILCPSPSPTSAFQDSRKRYPPLSCEWGEERYHYEIGPHRSRPM